jgi:hypothetical protein
MSILKKILGSLKSGGFCGGVFSEFVENDGACSLGQGSHQAKAISEISRAGWIA